MSADAEGRIPSNPGAVVPDAVVPDAVVPDALVPHGLFPDALFVDANIPMYAVGRNPDLRHMAEKALRRTMERRVRLITSAEVFQEILHHYLPGRRAATCRAAYDFLRSVCDQVLPVEERHTARAFEVLLEHPALDARDALHAAVMEDAGIGTILSNDRHFDLIPNIHRLDPAVLAAEE